MDLSASEIRVLGCLIEKQRTTPDAYPLSLNALRLACNQATNRDPVRCAGSQEPGDDQPRRKTGNVASAQRIASSGQRQPPDQGERSEERR